MSVVKSKRTQSKIEFEVIYFRVADGVDFLVEHDFFAEGDLAIKNRTFIDIRSRNLEDLTDRLLYYIKIANSLYPTCLTEWEERRTSIGKAIGTCYAILTNYQRVMMRLRVPDGKYTEEVRNLMRMINSLKAWRKSDNKLRAALSSAQSETDAGPSLKLVSASNAANANNNGNANNNAASNSNRVAAINPDERGTQVSVTFGG